jgi:hypothetical protein
VADGHLQTELHATASRTGGRHGYNGARCCETYLPTSGTPVGSRPRCSLREDAVASAKPAAASSHSEQRQRQQTRSWQGSRSRFARPPLRLLLRPAPPPRSAPPPHVSRETTAALAALSGRQRGDARLQSVCGHEQLERAHRPEESPGAQHTACRTDLRREPDTQAAPDDERSPKRSVARTAANPLASAPHLSSPARRSRSRSTSAHRGALEPALRCQARMLTHALLFHVKQTVQRRLA